MICSFLLTSGRPWRVFRSLVCKREEMSTFGAKLEHLLSSRAEIISRMHRPPAAEGNDLEHLLDLPPDRSTAPSAPPPNMHIWPDEQSAAFCAVTPPIETFMDVPDEIRREQFFTTARRDDMLVGVVTVIQDSGLVITILACDQGPRRDFDGLKLTVNSLF
ncbi:Tetratricopeptide repeat protein 14 [Fasciola hepatica]|uniref:Tetratricopeptide repeat protein 14 n=1 Tax=Fasciola hepatica TaxID=6192 RepID=A0A4E0RAW9_FASHE|nr:Tetratricopeptide repeat protein 14 [Fasciola hepatica]